MAERIHNAGEERAEDARWRKLHPEMPLPKCPLCGTEGYLSGARWFCPNVDCKNTVVPEVDWQARALASEEKSIELQKMADSWSARALAAEAKLAAFEAKVAALNGDQGEAVISAFYLTIAAEVEAVNLRVEAMKLRRRLEAIASELCCLNPWQPAGKCSCDACRVRVIIAGQRDAELEVIPHE